ncbi:MAG: hypothetical protein IJB97_06445 [Clostridia bacterium]|nr:hypothetical protein [Clostridia bacterium]
MHNRNAVRYFLAVAALLLFLFISNDFGLLDTQKTAIVMAVGIDREEDEFIVTSQIALPTPSDQKGGAKSVQTVSRGKTVAAAFEEINDKTGWYPKLVFCNLILIGKDAANENVFDALDFFLRNEYFAEDCLLAVCDSTAKEALNVTTPIDSASSVAAQKVLSAHAKEVGSSMPNTLREFAASYFGDSKSGFLPVLKTEKTQEPVQGENDGGNSDGGNTGGQNTSGNQSAGTSGSSGNSSNSGNAGNSSPQNSGGEAANKEQLFSAKETATFLNGRQTGKLTQEETFAFAAMKSKLKLATYSVESGGETYTLSIKHNAPKIKLRIDENGAPKAELSVTLTAGVLDFSKSETKNIVKDTTHVPKRVLSDAEILLKTQIEQTFQTAKETNCDLFGLTDLLKKYENKYFEAYKNDLLARAQPVVKVTFKSVR